MLALLAAATVASAAPPPARPVLRMARADPATVCRANGRYEISDPALLYRHDGTVKASRLGDLPKANHEKAVLRMIGPCANPMVVRYGAGR